MTVTAQSQAQFIHTPTVRQAGRRARFWIIAGLAAVVLVVASLVLTGSGGVGGPPLSATNAGPSGSKAIAQVLRAQGVNVTASSSLDATHRAAGSPEKTTIFVVDDLSYLNGEQLSALSRIADHVILMTPSFGTLTDAVPEIAQAGAVTGTLTADCSLAPVQNADEVIGDGSGYRVIDDTASAQSCLGSGSEVYSLIQLDRDGKLVTVVGTRAAFTNEHVAESGNAALALGLLGATETLIWYLPSIDDALAKDLPSSADLTPPWVSAVMTLLILVAIAAAFWRARRLGPLVIENLPVTVRASETMEGRARLYQRSSARLRALDALRIGTIARLATLCGLSRLASVDEVVLAVAAATGRPPQEIAGLLRDTVPSGDAEFVRLSDGLLALEREATSFIRPTGFTRPTGLTRPSSAHQPSSKTGE